jgi:hypothetical protein
MPVIEKFLQAFLDYDRRHQTTQKPQGRLIVYFIAQECSMTIRLYTVAVPPTPK